MVEYMTSYDGKPFPPHSPYLCPEARMVFTPAYGGVKMNVSQVIFLIKLLMHGKGILIFCVIDYREGHYDSITVLVLYFFFYAQERLSCHL